MQACFTFLACNRREGIINSNKNIELTDYVFGCTFSQLYVCMFIIIVSTASAGKVNHMHHVRITALLEKKEWS